MTPVHIIGQPDTGKTILVTGIVTDSPLPEDIHLFFQNISWLKTI